MPRLAVRAAIRSHCSSVAAGGVQSLSRRPIRTGSGSYSREGVPVTAHRPPSVIVTVTATSCPSNRATAAPRSAGDGMISPK
ncbi:Uncharacterised protein [Mycobacteroides abscessus subsp. abscessus]|nr:Uncharacterised protein [Mycobacteroides abscessus subsp. abscessus]